MTPGSSSGSVFGKLYASCYDSLYGGLDYVAHYAALKSGLESLGCGTGHVLDIGCGTGEFSKRLLADNYVITGVDPSETMLNIAKSKCPKSTFHLAKATEFSLNGTLDAAIMMGGVLGYQDTNDGVIAALRNAKKHLVRNGGLFVDVWNGNAVLSQGPSERVRVVEVPGGEAIRGVRGTLEPQNSVCVVDYTLWVENGGKVEKVNESHRMRYFTPAELNLFLTAAGFRTVAICPFPDHTKPLGTDHWHMMAVAVAAG